MMSQMQGHTNIVNYQNHEVQPHTDGFGWDILIQMELLTSLSKYTASHAITLRDVVNVGIGVCHALERCQKLHIIHRDIKPDNIFVSDQGDFKLGDFGIARTAERTMSGMSRKGTYTYMAPEIYSGRAYSDSVDLYSLGLVLYRLLNNNRGPFMPPYPDKIQYKDQEQALIRRMRGEPLPMPGHNQGRLAEIVLKACSFDPKDRYASPKEMPGGTGSSAQERGGAQESCRNRAGRAVGRSAYRQEAFAAGGKNGAGSTAQRGSAAGGRGRWDSDAVRSNRKG